MQNYLIRLIILTITLLWISACGGTGDTNNSSESSKIEVSTQLSSIDTTKTRFHLEFAMRNKYEAGVTAKLSNISLNLTTCPISQSHLNIADNAIEFNQPLESHRVIFDAEFTTPCIPTGYSVKANNKLNYQNTTNELSYNSGFKTIEIDANITTTTTTDNNSSSTTTTDNNSSTDNNDNNDNTTIHNYDIELIPNNESKIGLNNQKRYTLSLINLDNNRSISANSVTIRSSDSSKIKLINPNNYQDGNNIAQSELNFTQSRDTSLYLQTYNSSGVVNLNITANYTNNRNENYDINKTIPITILSGEPTAFSINSAGVEYNFETKWFEQKFLISASDRYNNIVNIHPIINVSAMADFTKDNDNKRILHGNFSNIKAQLIADNDTHTAIFESNSSNLSNVDTQRDFLLLFGDVTAYEALGKWNIDSYNNTATTLDLTDSYYGGTHNNLGFAIGHNYYNEICSSESKEWELKIDSTDSTYRLDDEGKTYITLKFPAYMIGKKIALSVNFSGTQKRSGEVHFETLHSFQGVKTPEAITLEANSPAKSQAVYFEIDTGTADRFWVKNARVVCQTTSQNVIVSNFRENNEVKNIADCQGSENGEIAYWQFTVSLIDDTKGGSFSFDECQVSSFIRGF